VYRHSAVAIADPTRFISTHIDIVMVIATGHG